MKSEKNKIGIFFGSDTGNTAKIATMIQMELGGESIAEIYDIANSSKEDIEKFNILLLGIPTWYYGEAQCDWDDFFPKLNLIDFRKKYVALFGCGDQEDYAEYFCDAMGTLRDILIQKGANMVGRWPITGYDFVSSKCLFNEQYFVGLTIDEDRQPELTQERVKNWVLQICSELSLNNKS
ncbi:MAG: flavodoxin FldA [Candidatus Dasytiphilus stammeri]